MVVNTSLLLTGFGGLTQRMTCSYTWGISEGLSSFRISWTVPLFTSRPDRTSTTQSSYSSSPPPAMLMTSKWYFCIPTSIGFLVQTLHGAQIEGNYQLHSLVMSNSIHELSFFTITCLCYLNELIYLLYRYMELLSSYLLPIMMTIAWLAAISVATKSLVYDRENGQEEVNLVSSVNRYM